jgi:phenylacetate-CoA ligase
VVEVRPPVSAGEERATVEAGVVHEPPLTVEGLTPSAADHLRFLTLGPKGWLLHITGATYGAFMWTFQRLSPRYLAWASHIRGKRSFYRAVRGVPAYRSYIEHLGFTGGVVPETDKESYIKAFPPESRCVGGRLPETDVMIDESAGSTGVAYNWVRTTRERHESHRLISYFATYCFGPEPVITINAFSMGGWATGINMGEALRRNGVVKNVGPDIGKILGTMSFFGTAHRYLVMGYPPFLKELIDTADAQGFPLADFHLDALVGGEGMSEGLRDYLLKRFGSVYSGYGATDLEIGIGGETPLSVKVRRLARDEPAVHAALFGDDPRLPMLFQYNPLMHYIEVNDDGEMLTSITRSSVLSPRVRYNIHDQGGVAHYDDFAGRLAAAGHDIRELEREVGGPILRLPFLWIFGRRDYTVSIMGANIYPEDLEQAVYADEELARITRSFCQTLSESGNGEVRPRFYLEIDGEPSDALAERFSEAIVRHLLEVNADFRKAWQEYPETMQPEIRLHRLGEGPFAADSARVKQVRWLKSSAG